MKRRRALLGHKVDASRLTDHNLGRVLDRVWASGTQQLFGRLAANAIEAFDIKVDQVHADTTSCNVYGQYDEDDGAIFVTYGYSKDKRPDLKQFIISMMCVERNIPLMGACHDGNGSDKVIHNQLLSDISGYMARHGLAKGPWVYVGDSAFVTEANLDKAADDGISFLTRLPATYKSCGQVIGQAVEADAWQDIGQLAEDGARYKVRESKLKLYGKDYRAIVVHSSAYDKRRHKRIDRLLEQEREQISKLVSSISKKEFFCQPDAS